MESFWNLLKEPDPDLFYKRGEREDQRFGELVESTRKKFGEDFKVVLIGFPYDEGAVRNGGRAGSASGPDEIRRAFYRLTPTKSIALNDATMKIFDAGNFAANLKLEDALSALEDAVTKLLRHGHTPIVLGGSNDLSLADFLGCHAALRNCGAINIDSHLDVRDYSKGVNSGTPYRMLLDSGELAGKNFAEYGIQEFVNSRGHLAYAAEHGVKVYTMTQIHSKKNSELFMQAYRTISEGTQGVYVSFDMDSVKSSDAPGVSAPTSTGLTAEEILECAYLAGSEEKTAMMDVCEFNPKFDIDGHTAKLAAMIVANFLAGIANRIK
jgi:formiminoglutamase